MRTGHEPQTSRIAIKPGVIYSDQIALVYNAVTFTWEVVPVTFQDRYDVVLTATYETNVPVPVVVIEPAAINLPKMCAGQVFTGEFRITNHGLIDAHDVKVPVPASDEYFSYELLTDFGDTVKAGQTVTVAYRVKCLKPLPGACPETADNFSSSSKPHSAVETLVARSGERQRADSTRDPGQTDSASTAKSGTKVLIAAIGSGVGPGGGSGAGGGTIVSGPASPLSGSLGHSLSACAPSGTGVPPVSGAWPIRKGSGGLTGVPPVCMGSVLLAACAVVFVVRRRRGAVQSRSGRLILDSAVEVFRLLVAASASEPIPELAPSRAQPVWWITATNGPPDQAGQASERIVSSVTDPPRRDHVLSSPRACPASARAAVGDHAGDDGRVIHGGPRPPPAGLVELAQRVGGMAMTFHSPARTGGWPRPLPERLARQPDHALGRPVNSSGSTNSWLATPPAP